MKKLLLPIFLLTTAALSAQMLHPVSGEPIKTCGTTEATQELYTKYPFLKDAAEIIEHQQQEQKINPTPAGSPPPVYIIPIVFHVLHNFGAENIPDANIYDEVRILNEDFRKLNADTSSVQAVFKSLIADCEIEFRLAQLDPNGNCTNGIDRIVTPKTYKAGDASKINIWPRSQYLNVWTVHDIANGAAGYTYVPSTVSGSPSIDGIIILYNYISSLPPSSSQTARALTHEIGHWFNLQHLWGSTNQPEVACGDDGVTDTPITKGHMPGHCILNDQVCTPGVTENVENYMEYSYCQKMYTTGQATRMRTALISSTAQRNNVWTATNLTATGVSGTAQLCTADFKSNLTVTCAGTPIVFTDLSWNSTPTSWQWDFNNDGIVDATTQNPTYTYSTSGVYSVKLTVSDGVSTKSVTKSSYVVVLSNTVSSVAPFSEGFESSGFPYSDWYTSSLGGNTTGWNAVTTASYSGSGSMALDNFSPTTGDVDVLITPSIDLSAIGTPTMSFELAYQRRSAADTLDQLRVLTSTDCGISWTQRYSKSKTTLATVAATSSTAFVPTAATQWRKENVSILNVSGQSNVRFKFEFTGHGIGNNIYVDDINITSSNSGVAEEFKNEFGLNVFPNPFNDNTNISFTINERCKVAIGIYDIIGKEVTPLSAKTELAAGTYNLPVGRNTLKSGIYFVKLTVDGYAVTRKIVVQ
ncbi:MAG TPA: M43 family zinc metalloprotease [Bacteroidia bacterium]